RRTRRSASAFIPRPHGRQPVHRRARDRDRWSTRRGGRVMRAAPRLARVKRERFMPFRYEPFALRMRLVDVRTDDEPPFVPEAADIDSGSLYLEDDRWERLRLRLTLDLDAGALERLIPEAEQSAPPIRFLLRIE